MNENYGGLIKELRESTGLSQAKFGEALGGIPVRTLQDWEAEKRNPPAWVVELISYKVQNDPQFKIQK